MAATWVYQYCHRMAGSLVSKVIKTLTVYIQHQCLHTVTATFTYNSSNITYHDKHIPYSSFTEQRNFCKFHKSIAIHKNFTHKMLAKILITISALDDTWKTSPSKTWNRPIRESIPLENNPLYGIQITMATFIQSGGNIYKVIVAYANSSNCNCI